MKIGKWTLGINMVALTLFMVFEVTGCFSFFTECETVIVKSKTSEVGILAILEKSNCDSNTSSGYSLRIKTTPNSDPKDSCVIVCWSENNIDFEWVSNDTLLVEAVSKSINMQNDQVNFINPEIEIYVEFDETKVN